MKNDIIDFAIAPYALADILLALNICGVKKFAVTKEEEILHIRVERRELSEVVYGGANGEDGEFDASAYIMKNYNGEGNKNDKDKNF